MPKNKRKLVCTPLTDEKNGTMLFIACIIVYCLFSATRTFWAQAMAELVPEGVFTKDVAGTVASAHMLAYGLGMFINGFLSEKVHPFKYIAASLMLSSTANAVGALLAYANTPSIVPYVIVWSIGGFSQSATWPSIIRIASTLMSEKRRATAGANLYASSIAGAVGTYLISQQVLRLFSWKELFVTSAAVGFTLFAFWVCATFKISKLCCRRELVSEAPAAVSDNKASTTSHHSLMELLGLSGGIAILISLFLKGTAYDGFVSWLPTMIAELFSFDASFSVMLSTILPVCNFLGVFVGRFIFDKLTHNEVTSSALYMGLGSVGLFLLALFGTRSLGALIVILLITAPLIAASATMYVSLVPLRFVKFGRSGTAAGLFNSAACAGTGLSSLIIGILSQNFGWEITLFSITGILFLGALSSAVVIRRFKSFKDM